MLGLGSVGAETEVPCYGVHEVAFEGPTYGPKDAPARDVELVTQWQHETGRAHTIHGFWDGDGAGEPAATSSRYASAQPAKANGR